MVSRFGGPAGLYEFWTAEIHRVQTQKRATKRVLKFCEMILSAHLAESRANTFNEDSRAATLQILRRLFQEQPGIMSSAAKQVGATIVWAENV